MKPIARMIVTLTMRGIRAWGDKPGGWEIFIPVFYHSLGSSLFDDKFLSALDVYSFDRKFDSLPIEAVAGCIIVGLVC